MSYVFSKFYQMFMKTCHAERVLLDEFAVNCPDYDCNNCNCYGFPCRNCVKYTYDYFGELDEFVITFED